MPGFFWALQKLSEQFRGSPQDHIPLAIAVWSQVHGTASLLISGVVEIELQLDLRVRCEETVRSLIQEMAKPLRETGQIREPHPPRRESMHYERAAEQKEQVGKAAEEWHFTLRERLG